MTDLGTVRQVDDGWELRFERRLRHPVERVWAAITDPDLLLTWWGKVEAADLRPGGRFVLAWQNEGGPTMTATITAYDPPRLLETEGDVHGRIRWELEPDGDGTRVVFLNTLSEPPSGEHLGMRVGFPENLAGWHWHLAALDAALDGDPMDISGGDMTDWEVVRAAYLLPELHRRWNDGDAAGFGARFAADGVSVGFDGTTVVGATAIAEHLSAIFTDHRPASYVGRVDEARALAPGTTLVRAVVGMVPPGADQVKPDVNAVQTLVVTEGRVALLQNTPAAFHGRPDDVERLTAELQALVDGQQGD